MEIIWLSFSVDNVPHLTCFKSSLSFCLSIRGVRVNAMNSSGHADSWSDALTKHIITFTLGLVMNCVNGAFVYTFFQSQEFQQQPR